MKIQTINRGEIDTDKLPDGQAELGESVQKIQDFIKSRNGEMFAWFRVPGNMAWCSINLSELRSVASVIMTLDSVIQEVSEGKLRVSITAEEE